MTVAPSRELRWSCDERNRAKCRNSHGCHCREITDLLHRLAAKPADDGVREATIEECAKEAERLHEKPGWSPHYKNAALKIAGVIRALSTKAPKP
jgi:hypothetical protein